MEESLIFDSSHPAETSSSSFYDFAQLSTTGISNLYRASKAGKYFFVKTAKEDTERQHAMLRREYELCKACDHPHIVHVFTIEENLPVGLGLIMEYIEGRTLAEYLAGLFKCNLFHMDDFYLNPEKRTAERLNEPGGNVDRERFLSEVLVPLSRDEDVFYKVYDCSVQGFKEPVKITPERVVITEGSYSCHPELVGYYDLHIFLSASPEVQMKRIINRNGEEAYECFKNKWIPLEEKYFDAFKIKEKCELIFEI